MKLTTPKITALRSCNQKLVNKWIKADVEYHQAVNDLNAAEDFDNPTGKFQARSDKYYDLSVEYWDSLPKDEQKNAQRQAKEIRGY